jgi:cobalt-zinc-cadmium efflux system protein
VLANTLDKQDVAEQLIALKKEIATKLKPFKLAHTTIEFELADEVCRDKNAHD